MDECMVVCITGFSVVFCLSSFLIFFLVGHLTGRLINILIE